MLKKVIFIAFTCFSNINLNSHGFGKDTFISLANHTYQSIEGFCTNIHTTKSKLTILTYEEETNEQKICKIHSAAKSRSNCCFAIGFDANSSHADIICTPDQEFYSISNNKWIPAYQLKKDDELLSKNNTVTAITYIEYVNEPIDVFIIEVKRTHTFFVGRHAILTHNILLPLGISMSIPFGGVTGGSIGSFFGPITCTIGILAGSIIGVMIKLINDDKLPRYKLPEYDVSYILSYRNSINKVENKKNEDAQAPGMPTAADGYEPPKKWDGKKIKNPKGLGWGWPDKKGRIWIPTGPNGHGGPHWDVEYPNNDDYDNVYPGGKIRSKRK